MTYKDQALLESEAVTILTVPGLGNSTAGHWQTVWDETRDDCVRVELGLWDAPHRNTWVNRLDEKVRAADRPVVLAAHSLGCHAVVWWAQLQRDLARVDEKASALGKVAGALLVAPPDVDAIIVDARLASFGPAPKSLLPFPSIVVASRDDEYIGFEAARRLADFWGSRFADAGYSGHINAASQLGAWDFGQFLLGQLTGAHARHGLGLAPTGPEPHRRMDHSL